MTVAERERSSALAGLKNTEIQAEDQCKLLYTTEHELATQKQLVLDLKAELQKVKDAAIVATRVAKETIEAAERAFYERGVEDIEIRLVKEVAGVFRDYCTETWIKALNSAGVPIDSKLRKAECIIFPEHIREAPKDLPSIALPLAPPEQVSSIQDPTLGAEAFTGACKGKELLPSAKDTQFEDALTIKDVISQAKAVESKSEAGDAKLKAADSKEGLQPIEK